MSSVLNLFPSLTKEQLVSAFPSPPVLSFAYEDTSCHHLILEYDSDRSRNAVLKDPRCEWLPEKHDLMITVAIDLKDIHTWFGMDCMFPEKTILGLALQWSSTKSDIRGTIPIGDINAKSSHKSYSVSHVFPKGTIKGSLSFKTIVYVKNAPKTNKVLTIPAYPSGTIIGEIYPSEIFIDGNGSLFPIVTVNEPKKPLWYVYFDCTDPCEDAFDGEHVEIRLNQSHPCYDLLQDADTSVLSPLFLEVLSSALVVIVNSAKDAIGAEWSNAISGKLQCKPGSIAEAIYYFVNKLEWNVTDTSKLSESIHLFIDSNLKGMTKDGLERT